MFLLGSIEGDDKDAALNAGRVLRDTAQRDSGFPCGFAQSAVC